MKTQTLWMCIWSVLVAHGYAEVPDPTTLLRGVQSAREQIPPSRLTVETLYHSELMDNEFTDVIEFDGELRRFEHTSNVPTRPDHSRTVFDGRDVLWYSRTPVSIYNLSSDCPGPLYDPRVLGITGALAADKTIKMCFPYHFSAKLETIGREEVQGIPAWHVRMTYHDGPVLDWWIDVQNNFRVPRYAGNWQVGSRTVSSSYKNPDYSWLPSRVVTEDFGSNGGIISRTELRILKAQANVKFPKATWTLAGFNLPRKTVITDTRTHTFGYWIDGRVMSAEEWNRLPPKGLRPAPLRPVRLAFIAVLVLVIAAPLLLLLRRAKR